MDEKQAKGILVEVLIEAIEHGRETDHHPDCPYYQGETKASSGAVSNSYRKGWDAVFGKVQVGQA